MNRFVVLLAALSLFAACASDATERKATASNDAAYRLRYADMERSLRASDDALRVSEGGGDAWAEALNNKAYAAYQQMRFEQALHLIGRIYRGSSNQLELLCADVLRMKVMQRIGQGKAFFDSRLRAQSRLRRILSEKASLSPRQQRRLLYAQSELHIVASTYYYYLGQDSLSRQEIDAAADCIDLEADTAQWLYYHYMLGSGGLVDGSPEEVTLAEFDHLFSVYTLAKANGIRYFQANALQSMAYMVADSLQADCLKRQRRDAYIYLYADHVQMLTDSTLSLRFRFAAALANHAITLFRQYRDLYQTACATRTLGEVYFAAGHYDAALSAFRCALHLAQDHTRSSYRVTPWLAGIHENLSLTYSALGNKALSDSHRSRYLDMLDQSRQNRELDSRKAELWQQARYERIHFALLFVLVVLVAVLVVIYYRQLARHSRSTERRMGMIASSEACRQAMQRLQTIGEERRERLEEEQERCAATEFGIVQQKGRHVLQRTKLSVVYAIIPYLDRVIAEVRHLDAGSAGTDSRRLAYIQELCDGMVSINNRLTEWIQMNRGRLRLHVTRFPLSEVFDVIRMQQYAFARQQLTLRVTETDLLVKADKPLTLFMVNTLADNARKFTPAGGTVTVNVSATADYVEIDVSDTGIGLSPQDVQTLSDSKVYDSSHLGLSDDGKGFGFGIMNCKGIIGSYRQLSPLFRVCDFGVESQQGVGSRFWFRLPRALMLVAALCVSLHGVAKSPSHRALFDSTYAANLDGRFADACRFAGQAIGMMEQPVDTPLLVSLYNEQAIAAQALGDWELYRASNAECVRLHRLYSSDASLASDCVRLERLASESKVFYVFLVLLLVVSLLLFYRVALRGRLRHQASLDDYYQRLVGALHALPGNAASFDEVMRGVAAGLRGRQQLRTVVESLRLSLARMLEENAALAADVEETVARERRLSFERDRFYVMNQILDNALSTIKHETMYFPSRIRQIADAMQQTGVDAEAKRSLLDLVTYYRHIYMLLYEQALRQTDDTGLRRQQVLLSELFVYAAEKYGASCPPSDVRVWGDRQLLLLFVDHLLADAPRGAVFAAEQSGDRVSVVCRVPGSVLSPAQLGSPFSPLSDRLSCLVMRQILRQHDAAFGHPGLRLWAEPLPEGFAVCFTLKAVSC